MAQLVNSACEAWLEVGWVLPMVQKNSSVHWKQDRGTLLLGRTGNGNAGYKITLGLQTQYTHLPTRSRTNYKPTTNHENTHTSNPLSYTHAGSTYPHPQRDQL